MGVVYKALDPAIGRTIAIKTIRLTDFADPDERRRIRERLLREAQSAGMLSHPNIVTIYDVLEEGDYAYVFMEFVNGSSLESLMRNGALPEEPVLMQFLREVADALDYAHRKGIVHRDIKPANIIISEAGPGLQQFVKITDFGVAKVISHEITHGDTMMGTPNYMSPEQIQGIRLDGRSDQFSLAVVVYELLSGVKPFASESLPALFYLICRQDPEPIHQVNPKLNENVTRALRRALAKDPEQRFGSCTEFIESLCDALRDCPEWMVVRAPRIAQDRSAISQPAVAGAGILPMERESAARIGGNEPRLAANGAPRIASADDSQTGAAPPPPVYELPPIPRRRRFLEDEDLDEAREKGSFGRKLVGFLVFCLAIVGVIAFVTKWNPIKSLPVQVLETKSAPTTPAPSETSRTQTAQTEQPNVQQIEESKLPSSNRAPEQTLSPPPNQAISQNAQPEQEQKAGSNQSMPQARGEKANQQPQTNQQPSTPPVHKRAKKPAPPSRNQENQGEQASGGAQDIADVELLSDPPGAKMVIDNRLDNACTSPCTVSLLNGRHTLLVELSGYREARRIFNVPDDSSIFVNLNKNMGVLVVTSSPPGASIFVDGKNYGHTPSTLHLPSGSHTLTFVNGPLRHDETVTIQPDAFETRTYRFQEQ